MSTTIDERVVEMRFDNSQFEKNVKTSMSTLDKLKQSLNLNGAAKGLESINSEASKFGSTGFASAVDTVRMKFSALQVMATTALANITNSAVNAGRRIASALTIEPIKMGFDEYETQINAVQTILANTESKGTTLDQVNNALDELNHYADKTIYNFTEMTRNIGTFTAAGVDLDTSVSAIKGIANLAAVSGSNSQQASTAMYQLSQALASGTVKLMDWNSVVNAGMGGQVFQDALKETARVHGIAIDDMIKKEGSFRETLSNGWLSSEILTETLAKFTGDLTDEQLRSMGYTEEQIASIQKLGQTANDAATKVKTFTQLKDTLKEALQSGWTQSWEIMIGDFEEAKSLWTDVSDYFSEVINKSAESRNNLLQGWADGGGREMAIESIKNAFNGLLSVIKPIKEAFREVFPEITIEQLIKITKTIRDFTAKLKLSDTQSTKLKATFKGLFSIVDIGITFITKLVGGIVKLLGNFKGLGNGILDITGSFGDWASNLKETIKTTDVFGKAIDNMVSFLQNGIDKVKDFIGLIKENFETPGFNGFIGVLKYIWTIGQKVGKIILDISMSIGEALANAFNFDNLNSGIDLVNGGLFATLLIGLKKFVNSLSDVSSIGGIFENIEGILDGVKGCLQSWQNDLKAATLQKIAIAIGILAASLLVISLIDQNKLMSSLTTITVLFGELMGSMSIFNKIEGDFVNASKALLFMIGISSAVLILATALKKISSLNIEELGIGILGITVLMSELVAAAKIMASDGTTVIKGAGQMLIMAFALNVLVFAFTKISELSWEELFIGMSGITVLIAELVAAVKLLTTDGTKVIEGAGQMILISTALAALAGSLKIIASMSWEELAKGLTGLTVSLGLLITAIKLITSDGTKVAKGAGQMILIAGALAALAGVMKLISTMSWEEIARGIVAIGSSMAILAIGLNSLKGTSGGAGSLLIAATALSMLAISIKSIGDMRWEDIAKGLIAIGGAMTILVVGLNAMTGTIQGSAALLVAASALTILGIALKMISSTSIGDIVKSLITIAGIFVIVGIAGSALIESVPAVLAFAAAVAAVGIACGLIGVGISLAATGLTLLINTIIGGATAIVSALTIIVSGVVSLIPAIVQRIGEAVLLLLQLVVDLAPALGETVKSLVLMIVDVLVECVPVIAEGALKLIIGVLNALVQYTPQLIEVIFNFLIGIFDGLAKYIPKFTQSFVNLFMNILQGIVDAINSVDPEVLMKGIASIGLLTLLMSSLAAMAVLTPAAMIGVMGLSNVITELAVVLAGIGLFAQIPGLTWLVNEGGQLLQAIGTSIGQFVGGIVGGVATGVSDQLPGIASNLSLFMTNIKPFIDGIQSIDASLLAGAILLASAISFITASSVISGIASFLTGDSSMTTFGEQLGEFGKSLKTFSDNVAGIDSSAVVAAAQAGKAIAEMASIIPNEGGMVAWFTGDNSIAKFGDEIASFGSSLKTFSNNVAGIDSTSVVAAANAGKAIAEMASIIPNEGGIVAWFTGDNSLAKFGPEISSFGYCLKAFANNVAGIDPEAVVAAAEAGKALAEMANVIPNEGGMVAWFTGDNSMAAFATQIVTFGYCLKAFANNVAGINADEVIAATNAAKALAEMANVIPNEGGMVSWFAGENSMAAFATQIVTFGYCLKAFANNVSGINPEDIVTATNAAKTIAQMADYIPNEGGVAAWFAGDNSISKFGPQIAQFGYQLKAFANNVTGIKSEDINPAVDAAKSLAEMVNIIPNEGGVAAWFAGDNSLSSFGPQIARFGVNLKAFSDNVTGISTTDITAAASAGKTLAEMANTLPTNCNRIGSLSDQLGPLAEKLKLFVSSMTGVDVTTSVAQVRRIITLAKDISEVDSSKISAFGKSLKDIGGDGITKFIEAFKNSNSQIDTAVNNLLESVLTAMTSQQHKFYEEGSDFMLEFYNGLNSKSSTIISVCKTMITTAKGAMSNFRSDFYSAGEYLVQGFVNGIKDHTYLARNAASSMAREAKRGVERTLNIHSPSRVMYKDGTYTGMGFVNALNDYGDKSYRAASNMGNSAKRGMQDAINKISDFIDSDMDTQPTIRPVLDLTDIKNGAGLVSHMLDNTSAIQMAGSINAMVNKRNQNGVNSDIVTAIDKLHKDLQNVGNTSYNINGITYDDGSNISEAIKTLVNAAVVERRM